MYEFQSTTHCPIDPTLRPLLVVAVDTEEDFDWTQGFSRDNIAVQSMQKIGVVQRIFDEYGITPVYMVDYPIVSQPDGYQPLQEIHSSGRCLIGAHLHPWVNPPFDEPVNRRNSFPGNLAPGLETAKLEVLTARIGEIFGVTPTIYKAGRYGIGLHTGSLLERAGYEVDMSVCPTMDYSDEGGPDFTYTLAKPHWFGTSRRLLELPLTVGFTGPLRHFGSTIYQISAHRPFSSLHLVGLLTRLGLINRHWLSPEGYSSSELEQLVGTLYRDGARIFSFAFHSPSVEPGHTPYVTTSGELEAFILRCRQFFTFFFEKLGGLPATPLQVKKELLQTSARHASRGQ